MPAPVVTITKSVVGVLLLRSDRAALLQLRDDSPTINDPGFWALPGGHLEPGESAKTGAIREFYEETAYRCTNLQPLLRLNASQRSDNNDTDLIFFWETYDGQQRIECREGQALRFVPRSELLSLKHRDYLGRVWDLGIAAQPASQL